MKQFYRLNMNAPVLCLIINLKLILFLMSTQNCCQQFFTQSGGLKLIKNIGEALKTQKSFSLSHFADPNQSEQVKNHGQEIYNIISNQAKESLSTSNVWLAIFREFKSSVLLCFLFVQIQMLCRFALCMLMKYLFQSFRQGQQGLTFLYVGLITFTYLFQGFIGQNAWRLIERVSISIKNSITYALYKKILALTAYNLGAKEVGTITNATTEFHDILENRSKFIFGVFGTPVTIITLSWFLVSIVGWYSLIGICLLMACEFIHYHYANYNSGFLDKVQRKKELRMELLHQVISAYRYVKMQIWEEMLLNKILGIRMSEMKDYLKYGGGISLQIALSEGVSTASMLIILRLTVLYYSQITSIDVILTVLCILQIKLVVIDFSYGISCFYQLQVLLAKIKQILQLKCLKMIKIEDDNPPVFILNGHEIQIECKQKPLIQLKAASIFLSNQPENKKEILSNVWLSVNRGDLVGIYGTVGGGKSTLLSLLASQIPYYSGSVTINGSVSFAEQQPIIFSQTIRENILFGRPMDNLLYKKVIQWSCLKRDLDSLPQRDMTKIYESSSNLSGGQKTRIALARCFYANKDILLLDDPLSSLDAVVANQLVKNLQNLQSLGKTIILVTHLTSYLSGFQHLYVVKNQTLRRKNNNDFKIKVIPGEYVQKTIHEKAKRRSSFLIQDAIRKSLNLQNNANIDALKYDENSVVNFGFWSTFFRYIYINNYNKLVFTFTLLLYILSETLYTLFVLLLSQYDNILRGESTTVGNQTNFWMFLVVLSVLIFLLQMLRTFFLNLSIQLSNHTLHQNGLKNYLSLSITQADNLGQKQVLTRFSTDLGLLDIGLLPQVSNNFISIFIAVIQSIVISIYNPIMLAFYGAIAILCYAWNKYCYLEVSLTKQLDLQLKGPIIGIFNQTMNGITQINMQNAELFMLKKFNTHLDKSSSVSYAFRKMFRVYQSYGVYIGCVFISGCYFLLVSTIKTEDIYKLTFAATFLVQINDTISFILSNFVKISSMLASVQRLLLFTQLKETNEVQKRKRTQLAKKQNQYIVKNIAPITQNNFIEVNNNGITITEQTRNSLILQKVSLKYTQDRAPVLSNIFITIKKGQKVAFIGRTGAGKSSMIQLIYRLIQPEKGSLYYIEGENALQMQVESLRRKFTCIPQTPFLFSDTLRKNVDPFNQHSQEKILNVLNAVQIWQKLQKQQIGLDSELNKVFESFSVGEKQLICLARAILQNRGYLILDQATSSIDLESDKLMQALIRQRFTGTTIIAVAHRLQTIADFDQIVVLSKGQIFEIGSPRQLYQKKGEFYTMVNSSQKNKQIIIQKIYESKQYEARLNKCREF